MAVHAAARQFASVELLECAGAVGVAYRKNRCGLPGDVQACAVDLMHRLAMFANPRVQSHMAGNLKAARAQSKEVLPLLLNCVARSRCGVVMHTVSIDSADVKDNTVLPELFIQLYAEASVETPVGNGH